ncbi:MAG TPA: hypothetical protein VGM59_00780 [Dongiaceae bacterium]
MVQYKVKLFAFSLMIALCATLGTVFSSPAIAEEGISDPKAWCGELTDLMAASKTSEMGQMFETGSRGAINPSGTAITLGSLQSLMQSGEIRLKSFLVEKMYGDSFVREWYMIVVDREPVFVRCSFIKYDETWQFTNVDFDSKADNVGLP